MKQFKFIFPRNNECSQLVIFNFPINNSFERQFNNVFRLFIFLVLKVNKNTLLMKLLIYPQVQTKNNFYLIMCVFANIEMLIHIYHNR